MKNPEHRVQITKQRLRNALTHLLKEKPLRSITVKELCEHAELNRGTFYSHYADVYDLMEQIEAEMEVTFLNALEPMLSSIGQPTPPKVTKKVFECIEANADLCRATIGPYGDKEFIERLLRSSKEHFLHSCERYFPRADPRKIESYYAFITGGCIALMSKWLSDGMTVSSSVLADDAEKIMECGSSFLKA